MIRLTTLSIARRTVVLLLTLLTVGLGIYVVTAINQELLPETDQPGAAVVTVYAGANPELVETAVSKPVETAVKGVPGVTSVTSTSSSSVSQVIAYWEFGNDPSKITGDIQAAVDGIRGSLPAGVDPRVVSATGDANDLVMIAALTSTDADAATLSQQARDIVAPELRSVAGVGDVTIAGEEAREVVITYDEKRLRDAGIDPSVIGQLFMANSTAVPSGTVHTAESNLDVQTGITYDSPSDLENLYLQGTDHPVQLKEVATVVEQPVETTSVSRVDGRPALTLSITLKDGANVVDTSRRVEATLDQLRGRLDGSTTTAVFKMSPFIEGSVKDLSVEGGLGLAMALLVIIAFLRSARSTLITAISIPLALLIALIGLYVGGYSLNLITLSALTVAIGRVVDDSIVVIENIKRHQAEGERGAGSVLGAVKEVAGAITSSTLTTVAVFVPIGLVGGMSGQLFRPFALTVTVALLGSLLVALTVVPVFAYWFMKPGTAKAPEPQAAGAPPRDSWLQRSYLPVLGWALRHRAITVVMAFAILAGTLALTPHLKNDYLGSLGGQYLYITQELPAGASLARTEAAARTVEAVLSRDEAVETYQTSVGGTTALGELPANMAIFIITLDADADDVQALSRLRAQLVDAGVAGDVDVQLFGSMSSTQIELYVEGSDRAALQTGNEQVLTLMKGIPGLINVASDLSEARETLSVDVDEKRAAELGLTQADIGQAVARAVRGQEIGTLSSGDTSLSVYLRSQAPAEGADELREIPLPVTQKMVADARQAAADEIEKRSDELKKDAEDAAADAYADQVKELNKARSDASKGVRAMQKQLKKAREQFESLQKKLATIPQKCVPTAANPQPAQTDPQNCAAVPVSMYDIAEKMSATGNQIAQLSAGIAQAKSGASSVGKQLDALDEQYNAQQKAQRKQDKVARDAKAIEDLYPEPVLLRDVAEVTMVEAPNAITRVGGVRAATVTAALAGDDLGTASAALEAGLANLDLPNGVTVRVGGATEDQGEMMEQMGLAMAVAIAMVFLTMVVAFGSLLQPLILLIAIPFAATGALGLSLATGTPLGLPSMIGLLMLIGIVVTNAIVLIDLINQKRAAGATVDDAVQAGARLRVRPIMMTALATVFALIPMALGVTGSGGLISRPLAIIVIGGLLSSTLLTLVLVPVLYDLLEKGRETRAARRRARDSTRLEAGDVPA